MSKPTSWVDDTDGEEDDEGGREVGHGRIDQGSHPVGCPQRRDSDGAGLRLSMILTTGEGLKLAQLEA